MKKVITIFIALIITLTLSACSGASSVSPLDIKEHPTLFGSIAEAEKAWKNTDKKAVILPSSYDKYNENTVLVVGANTLAFNDEEKDIIDSFEIYFKDGEKTLEEALKCAKEYFPNDVAKEKYIHNESVIYKCADSEKYYVARYTLKEDADGAGEIYVILSEENGLIEYITLGTRCPNWMNRSSADYTTEEWNFKF